jgi:8-oxo-dGTP pyrophosphatase MutT (NUDIX family)
MRQIQRFDLDQSLRVSVSPSVRKIVPRLKQEVDHLWSKRTNRTLVDAPIISLVHYEPKLLVGELVWFREWYAACSSHLLRAELNIHPLGVTARTFANGSLLIGRRAKHMMLSPGFLECCPSGHLDGESLVDGHVDFQQALLKELEEETSILPALVKIFSVHSLYWDLHTGVWDIHCDIVLSQKVVPLPRGEYSELVWVPVSSIAAVLKSKVLPLSRELLCVRPPDMLA